MTNIKSFMTLILILITSMSARAGFEVNNGVELGNPVRCSTTDTNSRGATTFVLHLLSNGGIRFDNTTPGAGFETIQMVGEFKPRKIDLSGVQDLKFKIVARFNGNTFEGQYFGLDPAGEPETPRPITCIKGTH